MNKEKILITGGSGFLGGYLIRAAMNNFEVIATYCSNKPDFSRISWLPLDLTDTDRIKTAIAETDPAIIIHTAAMTNVDICENRKKRTNTVNIRATEAIAKTAATTGARIIYISTDLVFDGENPPYSEEDKPTPLSYYGWSKWQGEIAIAAANDNHVIVRPSIIYGPPAISGISFSDELKDSWNRGQTTKLFVDQFRSPIFAGNLASALIEIARADYKGTLHIGGSERVSRYEFGICLAEVFGKGAELILKSKMSEVNFTAKRPKDVSMNIKFAKSVLKTELYDCREGIKKAYS
jgi:dTDP-4-dehydrorhamnose reductase